MNSKFFSLALCLGLFTCAINNSAFSMDDNKNKGFQSKEINELNIMMSGTNEQNNFAEEEEEEEEERGFNSKLEYKTYQKTRGVVDKSVLEQYRMLTIAVQDLESICKGGKLDLESLAEARDAFKVKFLDLKSEAGVDYYSATSKLLTENINMFNTAQKIDHMLKDKKSMEKFDNASLACNDRVNDIYSKIDVLDAQIEDLQAVKQNLTKEKSLLVDLMKRYKDVRAMCNKQYLTKYASIRKEFGRLVTDSQKEFQKKLANIGDIKEQIMNKTKDMDMMSVYGKVGTKNKKGKKKTSQKIIPIKENDQEEASQFISKINIDSSMKTDIRRNEKKYQEEEDPKDDPKSENNNEYDNGPSNNDYDDKENL